MSASASERHANSSKRISGWAEFDLKQRRRPQASEREIDAERYPVLRGPARAGSLLNKKESLIEKPFSSVVAASMNFPSLSESNNQDFLRQVPLSDSSGRSLEASVSFNNILDLADESLIDDLLAGVDNNVDLLDSGNDQTSFASQDIPFEERLNLSSSTGDFFEDNDIECKNDAYFSLLQDLAKYLPIEPELELEEDVYLSHRKDAVRMRRSASRQSKAANDAYIRGDHLSARYFSHKAQEHWIAAEKLNAKAAKDILVTRNSKNDMWTLDLHGLHAKEAVLALQEHLRRVESLVSSNCIPTLNNADEEYSVLLPTSIQSLNHVKMEKIGKQHQALRQQPVELRVITGKGNHSRGEAALPSAIRSFLNENGYHFDEKPGVVTVRLKFRQQFAASSVM